MLGFRLAGIKTHPKGLLHPGTSGPEGHLSSGAKDGDLAGKGLGSENQKMFENTSPNLSF